MLEFATIWRISYALQSRFVKLITLKYVTRIFIIFRRKYVRLRQKRLDIDAPWNPTLSLSHFGLAKNDLPFE